MSIFKRIAHGYYMWLHPEIKILEQGIMEKLAEAYPDGPPTEESIQARKERRTAYSDVDLSWDIDSQSWTIETRQRVSGGTLITLDKGRGGRENEEATVVEFLRINPVTGLYVHMIDFEGASND